MAPHSGLHWWLDQIGRIPLLTPAQEIELGTIVQAWLNHPAGPDACPPGIRRRGKRAKDRFVSANLRLAVAYISKHCHRLAKQGSVDDLVQAANEGLIRAVEKFDPTRGYRFSTYAYWWIRQAVNRWVDTQSRIISIPGSHSQLLGRLSAITRRLIQETGREPTKEELAAELGVSMKVLEQLFINAKPISSLDYESCDGGDLGDLIASYDISIEQRDEEQQMELRAAQLRELIKGLPKLQQQVLVLAWGLDGEQLSSKEIGTIIGKATREVDALLRECYERLRGAAVQLVLITVKPQPIPQTPRRKYRPRHRQHPGQLELFSRGSPVPWPGAHHSAHALTA